MWKSEMVIFYDPHTKKPLYKATSFSAHAVYIPDEIAEMYKGCIMLHTHPCDNGNDGHSGADMAYIHDCNIPLSIVVTRTNAEVYSSKGGFKVIEKSRVHDYIKEFKV